MALDPKDGGYRSRKFWFAMWATCLIFAGAIVGAIVATFVPLYDTMVGGVVAITGLLLTGNIANKWVTGKAINEAAKQAPVTPTKKDPTSDEE